MKTNRGIKISKIYSEKNIIVLKVQDDYKMTVLKLQIYILIVMKGTE